MKFKVTKKHQRPARIDGSCFYCYQKIGNYHKNNCVLVKKRVKVRAVIEYDIIVPNFWDKNIVEFHRNEGSWCSSNMIEELKEIDQNSCLCSYTDFEYIEDVSTPFLNEE